MMEWIILGNGPTGQMLADRPMPSSMRVISQNRVYPWGTNDAVVVSRPCYLDQLPADIARETVYVPSSWSTDIHYNRLDAEENSIDLAFALLAEWGQTRACTLGWDALAFGETEPAVPYPVSRGLKQSQQGLAQGTVRWRQNLAAAQKRWGIMSVTVVTPRELAAWIAAADK
jgi:hypothetical protein